MTARGRRLRIGASVGAALFAGGLAVHLGTDSKAGGPVAFVGILIAVSSLFLWQLDADLDGHGSLSAQRARGLTDSIPPGRRAAVVAFAIVGTAAMIIFNHVQGRSWLNAIAFGIVNLLLLWTLFMATFLGQLPPEE